jgi:uncharacterized protein YkwD
VKRSLLLFIVSLCFISAFSQGSIVLNDKPFIVNPIKDTALENWLNVNPAYTQLEPEEKELIYWVNYVRQQPKQFSNTILLPFLKQFPEAKSSYTQSLISELSTLSSLLPLAPSKALNDVARSHAKDLGINQRNISHNSSKGESFKERLNKFGYFECASENVYEGKEDGLQAVLFLLIDAGVPNLGHRKNILDSNMKYIGVSFFPVKKNENRFFMVQDFSCN